VKMRTKRNWFIVVSIGRAVNWVMGMFVCSLF